jgi:hypothetical protein
MDPSFFYWNKYIIDKIVNQIKQIKVDQGRIKYITNTIRVSQKPFAKPRTIRTLFDFKILLLPSSMRYSWRPVAYWKNNGGGHFGLQTGQLIWTWHSHLVLKQEITIWIWLQKSKPVLTNFTKNRINHKNQMFFSIKFNLQNLGEKKKQKPSDFYGLTISFQLFFYLKFKF